VFARTGILLLIAMDPIGGKHVRLDQLVQRCEHSDAGADLIGHGPDREFDPASRA
jgi:hypothetical protein